MSEWKGLSHERISNSKNYLWEAGFFWYQVQEWMWTLCKFSDIGLWNDFCQGANIQGSKHNNLDRGTRSEICIHCVKQCSLTIFSLRLWSSSPCGIFFWAFRMFGSNEQNLFETFVSWNQDNKKRFNWAACWRNSTNVTVDGSKPAGWMWQGALCLHSFLTDTKESVIWTAGSFRTILQCITCVWFQKCKKSSQFSQVLLATYCC